jgi:plastocyanin domain-containing protein
VETNLDSKRGSTRADTQVRPYALKQGHLVIHSMTPQVRFSVVFSVGLLAISFVGCAKKAPEPIKNPAVQEIKVTVKSEYSPDRIVVKKGQPVRLLFYREDDSECTAQVVIPDLKVKQDLALKKDTAVAFVPEKEGEFTFACGMDMMKGKLVVEK